MLWLYVVNKASEIHCTLRCNFFKVPWNCHYVLGYCSIPSMNWVHFPFFFFFFESNFCNWFVWLQSYSSKTVDSSLSPFFIFFCTFSEVKISPQPIVTASETFWSPNIWSFLYPHLIDINWFDQQMIWHLTKVTTLWLGCYSERSQTHCFCDFFTKNKSST